MINAFYLAYFNIESLEGSMFVNAIILGSAECFANIISGFLMLRVKEDVAFKICCTTALVFNLLLPTIKTPPLSYFILFLAIGGLGGMFNSMFVVVEMQVSPQRLGAVMHLLMTFGSSTSCMVSIIATLP
jgi:hypothetical protein